MKSRNSEKRAHFVAMVFFMASFFFVAQNGVVTSYAESQKRLYGGSLIVNVSTLLFDSEKFDNWPAGSKYYTLKMSAEFVSPDSEPDNKVTRLTQSHEFAVGPINVKARRIDRSRRWKGLEPGLWKVTAEIYSGRTVKRLLVKSMKKVKINYDKVATQKFYAETTAVSDPVAYLRQYFKPLQTTYVNEPN